MFMKLLLSWIWYTPWQLYKQTCMSQDKHYKKKNSCTQGERFTSLIIFLNYSLKNHSFFLSQLSPVIGWSKIACTHLYSTLLLNGAMLPLQVTLSTRPSLRPLLKSSKVLRGVIGAHLTNRQKVRIDGRTIDSLHFKILDYFQS